MPLSAPTLPAYATQSIWKDETPLTLQDEIDSLISELIVLIPDTKEERRG